MVSEIIKYVVNQPSFFLTRLTRVIGTLGNEIADLQCKVYELEVELAHMKYERDLFKKESEGRRKVLLDKADELQKEWVRAEQAEGRESLLKAEVTKLRSMLEANGKYNAKAATLDD